MEKRLPFDGSPVSTYPFQSGLLTIASRSAKFQPWIANNFIQMNSWWSEIGLEVNFYYYNLFSNCPLVNVQAIHKDTFAAMNVDFIEWLKQSIVRDQYVFITLDSFHIKAYTDFYQKTYRPHTVILYGFNEREQTFDIADHFESKFATSTASFQEIEDAYASMDPAEQTGDFRDSIALISLKSEVNYSVDIPCVIAGLDEYVNSKNSSRNFAGLMQANGNSYGLEVTASVAEYYKQLPLRNPPFIDIKPIHLLFEHKKLMENRIQYFMSQRLILDDGSLLEKCTYMKKKLETFRTKLLLMKIRSQPPVTQPLYEGLKEMIPLETQMIHELIGKLEAESAVSV